jgi:hypothetical protein
LDRYYEGSQHLATLDQQYSLSKEDWEGMLALQDGKCGICLTQSSRQLVVDHDHTTGEVRGLLCHGCNRGLGMFRDSPSALRRAASYLEKPQTKGENT